MCDQLGEKDEVVLDITHALRSLPLLAMVVLQYMRVLKDIILNGIFYGAFEVLGFVKDVMKMPLEKRRVPIFDLTAFARLTDWSVAVDHFLAAGDATQINDLVKMEALPIIKAGASHDRREEAIEVKNLAKCLLNFTNAMTTCRGLSISKCANSLNVALDDCAQTNLVTPFVPLLGKIRERTKGFSGSDEILDGVHAAKWCLEHNLIQQAYTILQETGISFFLAKAGEVANGTHLLDLKKRNMVAGATVLLAKKEDSSQGHFPEGYEDLWQRIWTAIQDEEGCRTMNLIEQRRNDLNHAGINNSPIRAEKFDEPIRDAIDWFEKALNK